ncbi:hypothetical protein D3C74_228310 [compost metagenome]
MRQVGYGLHRSLEVFAAQLVEQHRKGDWNHKSRDQAHYTHGQRIAKYQVEPFILEQVHKVFKSYPFLLGEGF